MTDYMRLDSNGVTTDRSAVNFRPAGEDPASKPAKLFADGRSYASIQLGADGQPVDTAGKFDPNRSINSGDDGVVTVSDAEEERYATDLHSFSGPQGETRIQLDAITREHRRLGEQLQAITGADGNPLPGREREAWLLSQRQLLLRDQADLAIARGQELTADREVDELAAQVQHIKDPAVRSQLAQMAAAGATPEQLRQAITAEQLGEFARSSVGPDLLRTRITIK